MSGGANLANEPGQPLGRVGGGERPRPSAHGPEPSRVGQEARESLYEPLCAEIGLGQEDGATGGLHEPRIGRLLVPGGSGQRDENSGQAEIAALVERRRPAPAHEEGGGGVDVAQLGPT
jgi:hypothetical protein